MSNMSERASARKIDLPTNIPEPDDPENPNRFLALTASGDKRVAVIDPFDDLDRTAEADDYDAPALPRRSKEDSRPWWKRGGEFLKPAEEAALAKKWRESGDRAAADRIIAAHLPLVAKCAAGFPSLDHAEAMAAGCIGIMKALPKFDPEIGTFRTYAMSWINNEIRLAAKDAKSVVRRPRNTERCSDSSLDLIFVSRDPGPEDAAIASEENANRNALVARAIGGLNERERRIFEARKLSDDPLKLDELATELGISRERVRQIEVVAEAKVKAAVFENVARIEGRRTARRPTSSKVDDVLDPLRSYRMLIDMGFSPETAICTVNEPGHRLLHRIEADRRLCSRGAHRGRVDHLSVVDHAAAVRLRADQPPRRRVSGTFQRLHCSHGNFGRRGRHLHHSPLARSSWGKDQPMNSLHGLARFNAG